MKRGREEAGLPDGQETCNSPADPKSHIQEEGSHDEVTLPPSTAAALQPEPSGLELRGQSSDSSADQHQTTPTVHSQSELNVTPQPHQGQLQLVLELDSHTAPPKRMQLLKGHIPYPQHHKIWLQEQHNPVVCGIRLVGDAQQPDEYVGVGVHEMIAHTPWAAARMHHTQMQPSGLEAIVPICSPVAAVRKLVEALYSGFIMLQEDAEQIQNLANCMQVHCHSMSLYVSYDMVVS